MKHDGSALEYAPLWLRADPGVDSEELDLEDLDSDGQLIEMEGRDAYIERRKARIHPRTEAHEVDLALQRGPSNGPQCASCQRFGARSMGR